MSPAKPTTKRALPARARPVPEKRWVTVPQAAKLFSCSTHSLYRNIRAGKIPAVHIPAAGLRIDLKRFYETLGASRD